MSQEEDSAFLTAVYRADLAKVHNALKSDSLHPHTIKDNRGFTAFHILALNNNSNTIQYLIRHVRLTQTRDKHGDNAVNVLRAWANARTEDLFTCLHFAVYKGNLKITKMLIDIGADIDAKNKQGLGVMHIAAQGDQPLLLAYFRSLQQHFTHPDFKGSTPLHWAAYLGCELAASLLLAWDVGKTCLNAADGDGHTPLHLATIAGHQKMLKYLLIKGADTNKKVGYMQDVKGRTACQIAEETSQQALLSLLQDPGITTHCGIKPPLRPIRCRFLAVTLYILLFLAGGLWNYNATNLGCSLAVQIGYLATCGLEFLLFVVILLKNPGYVNPKSEETLLSLYEKHEAHYICAECKIVRPHRSRHCQFCDRCVEKFDHHCPWVNNCIGARNLGWFLAFVAVTELMLLESLGINAMAVQVDLWAIVGLLLSLCFLVPVSLLLYVQIHNFLLNQTTNERYSHSAKETPEPLNSSLFLDKSSKVRNCGNMCCNLDQTLHENEAINKSTGEEFNYTAIIKEYENPANRLDEPLLANNSKNS